MPLEGRRLTGVEVAALCYGAGWRRTKRLVTAVAVANAESRFYEGAYNDQNTDGSIDRGLFQINSIHGYPENVLFDAERNTVIAFGLYKGRGYRFTPWAAYTRGGYLFSLPDAMSAVFEFMRQNHLPVR